MKKQNLPLISVIIPTYKRAHFLKRAVDSVLNQSYPCVEVLVIDDNDPDTEYRKMTERMMEDYQGDERVKYICHPKNRNGAAARNTGLSNSTGELVCFLDDDDWYLPDKLEKQVEYLQKHPQFDAVYCGYDRDGKTTLPHKTGDLTFELLSGTDIIYTNTIMMKRKSALECGGWDERFRRNQEAVFLIRFFSEGGKIGALPKVQVMFDTSDASNRSNPQQFEKDFSFYLEVHQKEIEKCTLRYENAREMIYSYRYRGILLNYIKYGCFKEAFFLYRKMSKMLPHRFFQDCVLYVVRRILRQPVFKEFERNTI